MNQLYFYIAEGCDPYRNLAAEQYLLEILPQNSVILYLWQNAHTVVIGRNQNARAECRCALLEQEGGKLARRLSGGGAVYHDLGNLNFTFLCNEKDYDIEKQLQVVQSACAKAGIQTERSGRNDVLAEGRKFSGNAFYHHRGKAYHHGTLLIDTDAEKMQRYLSPPAAKLKAKGVSSVRARVVNLKELAPALTCDKMKDDLLRAFEDVYGGTAEPLPPIDEKALETQAAQLSSWEHLFGSTPPYALTCEQRFDWGQIQLNLQVEKGIIRSVCTYTDAMEHTLPEQLQTALIGLPFTPQAVQTALAPLPYANDLFDLLLQIL